MTLSLDFTNMIGAGVTESEWTGAGPRFRQAHQAVESARHRPGAALGWIDLPNDAALQEQATLFAERARGRFDEVVVLGIGGSALGPIALRTALRPSGWNFLSAEARGGLPRLHVLDNVDPETIAALLARLDLARTLFIVTSK